MKNAILSILAALGLVLSSVAADPVRPDVSRSIVVSWNPGTDPQVVGWRVRCVDGSGAAQVWDSGSSPRMTISTTAPSPLRISVTSYNAFGWESDPSDEVMIVWPSRPARPIVESVVTTIVTTTIETSP